MKYQFTHGQYGRRPRTRFNNTLSPYFAPWRHQNLRYWLQEGTNHMHVRAYQPTILTPVGPMPAPLHNTENTASRRFRRDPAVHQSPAKANDLKSIWAEKRAQIIANVKPRPSANNNLLLIRGICNTLMKVASKHWTIHKPALAALSNRVKTILRRLPVRLQHKAVSLAQNEYGKAFFASRTAIEITTIALFEGFLVWYLFSLKSDINFALTKTVQVSLAQ